MRISVATETGLVGSKRGIRKREAQKIIKETIGGKWVE